MRRLFALFVFLGLVAGCDLFAAEKEFDSRPLRRHIIEKMGNGEVGDLAEKAYTHMVTEAVRQLKKAGKAQMAEEFAGEWLSFGNDLLTLKGYTADVGDHDPFSEWIAVWYQKLEDALGIPVMEATHLRDIWVLNYTLKVVFRPSEDSKWCVEWEGDCQAEYRRHFAGTKWQRHPDPEADAILHHGFAGVVTYWVVYGGCSAAGGFMVCGVAGTGAQFIMERYFAPVIADSVFERVNEYVDGCDGIACESSSDCECGEDCECGDDCDCEDCDHCDGDAAVDEDESEAI